MELRMDEIGDFLYGRVKPFNCEHQTDRERLEHPFGCGNIKINPGYDHQNPDRKLHHDTVFGRDEFDRAPKCKTHAFEPSGKKSIVFLEFHYQ